MEGDALQLLIKGAIVGYMLICLAIGFFLGRRSNRFEHGHITCALVSLNSSVANWHVALTGGRFRSTLVRIRTAAPCAPVNSFAPPSRACLSARLSACSLSLCTNTSAQAGGATVPPTVVSMQQVHLSSYQSEVFHGSLMCKALLSANQHKSFRFCKCCCKAKED